MADDSQRIKALVIRAEDSRLMGDMSSMRKAYTDLNVLNSQLVGELYRIRRVNIEYNNCFCSIIFQPVTMFAQLITRIC